MTYRWGKDDATTLRYSYASTNYTSDPTSRVLDRDGTAHVFSASHSMLVDNAVLPLGVNLQVGINRSFNEAEGDDYAYDSYGWFFSASRQLPYDIRGSVSFSHQLDDYRNPNSLAGVGFDFNRADRIKRLNFYLERPVPFFDLDNLSVFVNWQYVDSQSSISFFDYTQTTFNLGVTARF